MKTHYLSPLPMGGGEKPITMIGSKMPAGQHRLFDDENKPEGDFTHYLHLGNGQVVRATLTGHPGNYPTTHTIGKTVHSVIAVAPREWESDE